MFNDSEKVPSYIGKRTTCYGNIEILKKDTARKECEKLIAQGWRRTEEDEQKKRAGLRVLKKL